MKSWENDGFKWFGGGGNVKNKGEKNHDKICND